MGCWCSLELSGGRFNDGMAPVSMDMEESGHRCYARKLNEKELGASPGQLLFDGTRDGGTVYRVCLVLPRNASTGGRIRGWRGGRRAPGRPSIPIECGLARTVRWSTRVGCPRRAPPERPGRSSGQGGRGRETLRAIVDLRTRNCAGDSVSKNLRQRRSPFYFLTVRHQTPLDRLRLS